MRESFGVLLGTVAVVSSVGAFAGCSLEEVLTSIDIERPAEPRDLGPPQRVFARRFVSPIRDAPSSEGARLGYLRAGALLHSTTTEPVGYEGCEGGWYELDTGGYACHLRDILVFSGERLPELRARQPDRDAVMPYEYVTVRRKTPLYKRLPTADEVYTVPEEPPDAGVDSPTPGLSEESNEIDNPLVLRLLRPGFYVSLDRSFERDSETYWRTQQNGFVPAKPIRHKEWSDFHGQMLDGQRWDLPVAVTRVEETTVYRFNDREKLRATRERLERRSWLAVGARRRIGETLYLVVGDGRLVREADVLVIEPSAPPAEVGEGERWIDIDLRHQVLVAYEWKQPRYVSLVSTGRTRTPSPELDYRTPKGLHRIRGKHLTSTMDNDEPGEPPYSLEDVPYVMYFRGAYAFHSAFWHDRFGRPRSHGCINLAPRDAKWLYNWAGPDLPESWHGGSATEENPGTWVYVHGDTPGQRGLVTPPAHPHP
jgi:hypothetical protein